MLNTLNLFLSSVSGRLQQSNDGGQAAGGAVSAATEDSAASGGGVELGRVEGGGRSAAAEGISSTEPRGHERSRSRSLITLRPSETAPTSNAAGTGGHTLTRQVSLPVTKTARQEFV